MAKPRIPLNINKISALQPDLVQQQGEIVMKNKKILIMAQLAIFTAIELVFCFTLLGSVPIGPGIVATLAHIPAIIAALTLGKKAGLYMGSVMGISSLIVWTFMPPNPLVAFAFSPFMPNGNFFSLLISIVPRVFFPFIAAVIFIKIKSRLNIHLAAGISALAASLVHSALVLTSIYLVFKGHPMVGGSYINFLIGWGVLNAVIEAIIAAVLAAAIIKPLSSLGKTI